MMKLKNLVFALAIVGVASVSSTTFAATKTPAPFNPFGKMTQQQCLDAASNAYQYCKSYSVALKSKTLAQCDNDKKVSAINCMKNYPK